MCLCVLHSSSLRVGRIAEAPSRVGADPDLRYSTSKDHLPDLPKKCCWTNTKEEMRLSLAITFYRRYKEKWVSFLGGKMWMFETHHSLQRRRWVRLWALFFQKETLRNPSWPRRCDVGWISLLPPTSFRQRGREIIFTVWLLWKCGMLRCP